MMTGKQGFAPSDLPSSFIWCNCLGAQLGTGTLIILRHTSSVALVADENPKVVSERLGHSSILLTPDTHSHVLPSMQKAATDKLAGMLFLR